MKDERSSLIYVLADYKQLLLQYKAKFAQTARQTVFWKVTAIGCIIIIFSLGVVMYFWLQDAGKVFADSKNSISQLNLRLEKITLRLDETQDELKAAKDELRFKGEAIGRLEQGISSASKRLVENLLRSRQ